MKYAFLLLFSVYFSFAQDNTAFVTSESGTHVYRNKHKTSSLAFLKEGTKVNYIKRENTMVEISGQDTYSGRGWVSRSSITFSRDLPLDFVVENSKVKIKSDQGEYIAECTYCQITKKLEYSVSAVLHPEESKKRNTVFTMSKLHNGNYVFKNASNYYLEVCSNCIENGSTDHFIFFNSKELSENAQFKINKLENGKYSILSVYNDLYLSRCNDCSQATITENVVTAHQNDYREQPWAQWGIEIQ